MAIDDRTAARLDNPLWSSLTTLHAPLAVSPGAVAAGAAGVARYPADVAPFLAVEDDRAQLDDALAAIVPTGDSVLCIGPRPAAPAGWRLEDFGAITQMVFEGPAAGAGSVAGAGPAAGAGSVAGAGPAAGERDAEDAEIVEVVRREDVLELAALVYPHYFRRRTPELGRYFGIYRGGVLAAMAGERMGFPGAREISAVCTRPEFVGQGMARRLMAHLVADLARSGASAFLHVAPSNRRAVELYERTGWRARRPMPFCALHR